MRVLGWLPRVPQAALWGPLCSISPTFCLVMLSAPIHVWQSLLHAFCVWLTVFGDRMLEPEHFQFVWSFFTNYRSFLFTCYVAFLFLFLAFSWEREGPDQGWDELRLAYGLFLPCMALEQDEWHVISLNSQTFKQVTHSLHIQKQTQRGHDLSKKTCLRVVDSCWGKASHYCLCSAAGIGYELQAITVFF